MGKRQKAPDLRESAGFWGGGIFIPFLYFILSVPEKPHPPAALRQKTPKDKLVGRGRKDAAFTETSIFRQQKECNQGGEEERKKRRNKKQGKITINVKCDCKA